MLRLMSLFAAMGLVAVLAVAAKAGGQAAQVTIDNFAFSPATLQVQLGATVIWVNNDDIPHKVVADEYMMKKSSFRSSVCWCRFHAPAIFGRKTS